MTTTWASHSDGMTTDAYEIYIDLRTVSPANTDRLGPYVPPEVAARYADGATPWTPHTVNAVVREAKGSGAWGLRRALESRGARQVMKAAPLPGRSKRPESLRPRPGVFTRVARMASLV